MEKSWFVKREILFYEKLIEAYSIDIIFLLWHTGLEIKGIHPRITIIPLTKNDKEAL